MRRSGHGCLSVLCVAPAANVIRETAGNTLGTPPRITEPRKKDVELD